MSVVEEPIHPEILEEKPPEFIVPYYRMFVNGLASYGWIILGCSLVGFYIWHQLKPTIDKWRLQYDQSKLAAECKKNPNLLQARQEAIERARRRMQEEHDKGALIHAEKMKALEEKRTMERLQRAVGSEGYRLDGEAGSSPHTSSQTPDTNRRSSAFKPEYNPLMGAGGSGGYRAPKRGCPGGGCGKKK